MNRLVRRLAGLFMAALLFMNTACYAFIPVATGVGPASGDYVRVRLNAAGTSELANSLGPGVEWAEGTVTQLRADGAMVVGVVSVRLLDGLDRFWSGSNSVAISPAQIAEVQRKTLDKGRSRVATIALAGALAVVALVMMGAAGVGGGPGDGGGQPPP